ncbi:MAG: adenosylcobinamide-phosphate synthase CbiB [Clostridiales bacterium]|nr:adenosylcobinamide-phosphate synthase CbiB [Clostridiales bacterium]
MVYEMMAAIWLGFVVDLIVGDPQGWPHVVRLIGWVIQRLEITLRKYFPQTKAGQLAAGRELVILVLMATAIISTGFLRVSDRIHPLLFLIISVFFCWQVLAAKSLYVESGKVWQAFQQGDTGRAREAVSMIVGRDTELLDEAGIIRAAIETVAENTSDGVVAPLFYLFLLGPVGGLLYKAVNTMDSMVGYQNEKYRYFGRAAAKIDDLLNWIPSRLSALLMIAAAWLLPGYDGAAAWRIWRRDRHNHKSPNSAQTEAACAGALHLMLAGDAWYFGELHHKPTIGDPDRTAEADDIRRAGRLMLMTAFLALVFFTVLMVILTGGYKG